MSEIPWWVTTLAIIGAWYLIALFHVGILYALYLLIIWRDCEEEVGDE